MKNKKVAKIIVNTLSMARIIGAILMPLFFNVLGMREIIIVLICLFITDTLDGFLARKWKVQTRGGALLDPLGDKLLAVSCIFSFIKDQPLLLVVLLLDVAIATLNIYRALHGEEFKTSIVGKVKTWVLFFTLALCAVNSLKPDFLATLNITISTSAIMIAMGITLALQVVTIAFYAKDSIRQRSFRISRLPKLNNFSTTLKRLFDEEAYLLDKDKPLIDIIRK